MSKLRPRCTECGIHLVMHTDAPFGYGRLTWLHEGPCIKPTQRPIVGYCAVDDCERPVYGDDPDGRKNKRLWCSEACEKILLEERRKAGLAACKKYQEQRRRSSTTLGGRAA